MNGKSNISLTHAANKAANNLLENLCPRLYLKLEKKINTAL